MIWIKQSKSGCLYGVEAENLEAAQSKRLDTSAVSNQFQILYDSSKVTGLFSLKDRRSWVLMPVNIASTEYMCSLTRSMPGQTEKQLFSSALFISFATTGRCSPLCRSVCSPQLVLSGKYLKEQFRGMALSGLQIQSDNHDLFLFH